MRSRAVAALLASFLSLTLVGIHAFDDSSAFIIEVSEPQSNADPSSCDAPDIPYSNVAHPIGNAIREVDRGPGDPPLASTEHRFSDADGTTRVPYQFNTSSRYANISIHEVVGHVHSRSGFDVVVIEMNRLTTGASSSIRPDSYFDTRENLSFPMRSNNASMWSEIERQDSVRSGGGPFTNTEFRAGTLDSVNHLFVTLMANRTSLFMLTFPSDAGAPDTQSATSVNDVRLPADLPPLAHITGLQFDNYTQIFYGAALSLAGEAYVLSLTPATELDAIYRDCSLPKRSGYPARLCDRVSIKEFLANGTRADFQRTAVIIKHHTITSATAISLTAFDRASRIFMVIVMNGESLTRPCADNHTSSFDLVGVRVTALFASQRQAFRVRIEGDAAVAMECDNLLGTCFLLRLRSKIFEYVKFSSNTGQILRVLIAPSLRQGEILSPHQFAVGVGSFDAFEDRFLTLSIQDIAEMSPSDKFLLNQYDSNISKAQLSNLTELQVFNSASDDVKLLLARRNAAYGNYYNLPPPLLPYRLSGGAHSQVPEFPPTDEMSRVHTVISGARVNNLVTPNFLDTLGPIAEDEAAFIPPDPLEDKIFIDSSTYDVNSTRKVVTMIAYEFSDKPYFFGTAGEISVAAIAGGLPITVIGDHFQPSGFAVARFTDVQSWFPYYASLKYINKTHAVFFTPRLPSAAATHLQVSNNGFIFTSPLGSGSVEGGTDEGFGFYEVSSRRPISGSSVGRTGVILRGSFLQRMVKAKAFCSFAPCDSLDVQSPTYWSEELQAAVCFSPPISRQCSEAYIASTFRVLVGYEQLIQDIWFYVEDDGPSILQAQFDPSLRSIVVRFRSSTNVGSYNRSESCSKLFTIQSQQFILLSTAAFWPEPFTLILLLDQSHRLRFNSIIEFSNGGDVTDASDKSLTLAGAVLFAAPTFIEPPSLVLTCPLYVLSNTDVFISAQHSFGLTVQNVSFSWNVSVSTDFGFSKSLDFSIVQENVIHIPAINISSVVMLLESQKGSIQIHTQFTAFFNGSTGKNSPVVSNISSNSSSREPSINDSPQCSKFKTVQDAVKNGATTCISWQHVSSTCVSQVLLPKPEHSPRIRIDRPFNSSFTVPSDSEVFFRSIVTDPFQNNGTVLIRWQVATKKSGLIPSQLQSFCEMANTSSGTNLGSPIVNISGPFSSNSCLKGSSGLSVIFAGNESDKSFNINLPFEFRWFSKSYKGNVFVRSQSYVIFGDESTEAKNVNVSNSLQLPTLFVGSTNISMLLLMSGFDSSGWRVRFEGTHGISGTTGNSSVIWELLFKTSGGLELCTGELLTQATSVSAVSDGIQLPQFYSLEPFSIFTFTFDSFVSNASDPTPDFCDLNALIKRNNADLALTGATMLLPRNSLPPGSYEISASLFMLSNCSWVSYSNNGSGNAVDGENDGSGNVFDGENDGRGNVVDGEDDGSGNVVDGEESRDVGTADENARKFKCEEKISHRDSVNLQIIGVHSSPVTYINGAVSSGSPFFVESGGLVCIEFDNISSCRITRPTAFSESFKPLDPDFEDLQSSFNQIISKSRQFLSMDADDLVLLNSAEFSRLFCSRCNGQLSSDIISYINRFFNSPSSDFQSVDADRSDIDDMGVSFEFIPTSNVSYTLEQVCLEHFYLNATHLTRNCTMFLNATRSNIKKYLNDSEPLGYSLQHNVLSVESIFICQYNFSYFNVLLKDPSVYSTRLNPLYSLQWSCVVRPAKEPSSGYHSKNPYDTPCSNFTSSPYYAAAIFYDQINTSMVVRISCSVLSNHVTWHLPSQAVVVLYPFLLRSVLTQQMIPVNPSLSAFNLDNVPYQRAHLLRYSNSSSPYVTLISNANFDFSFVSAVRWESRVPWLTDLSSSLLDSMFNSNSFVLDSQLSIPSSLLSLGFSYVFRVSHFYRGQLSGFSEIVVNMSSPFFQGKASVYQLPSGLYQISTHRIEVDAEDRPLQFLFLQSLDFDLTLQPIGFSQMYTGPIYNTFQNNSVNNSVASIVILTQTASQSTTRTYVSVSLSSAPIRQVYDIEKILYEYRQSSADFFVSSLKILQSYQMLSVTLNLSPLLSLSEGLGRDINSVQTIGDLFERRFLEPIVQLLCSQYFFSQGDLRIFISKEVDFTTILKSNSSAELLQFGVPGLQGAEHMAAVLFEGFRIFSNGSIPSTEVCKRLILVISRLVELDIPFSSAFSSSLFNVLARCLEAEVADLYDTIDKIATFQPNFDTIGTTNTTFSSNSSFSESTPPNPESLSRSLNPPRRSFLSGLGTIYGTCFMRVGAVDGDLTNNEKSYSVLPAIGDPSSWNVVFQSTVIISPNNLSVYRFFSEGSNRPSNASSVEIEYKSNSFGGSWSDSDAIFSSDVANSSRISGLWGGPGTGLTALFKFFDQPGNVSRAIALVELGWVSLNQGKGFDDTNRYDVDLLRFPFDNSWNVTRAQSDLGIAPYRCQYPIMLPPSAVPASVMAPNKIPTSGFLRSQTHFSQRQLLQQLSLIDLQNQLKLTAAAIVNNAMNDFDAVCTRIRETSSLSGAPVSFSYSGTVVYSRNFYTRSGVTFETPQFTHQGVSCSSVAVHVNSNVPTDQSLDFHRSSLCIGVTVKDLTPSSQTVGGTSGVNRMRSSCTILYKIHHGTYDPMLGIITSTVSLSYFTFLSVWARTLETKALCQFYQDSTNSFTTFGVPSTPPTEEVVSSFELLPNRTAAQVCKISQYAPLFSITNNRVTCRFNIKSEATVVPSKGLLSTFQENVDCTGAISGKGTMCDGCEVCFGNGSTCNADCDTAVASGRKYDDCQLCGGSTFYHPSNTNGLPWMPAVDEVEGQTLEEFDFKLKYCEATRVFAQPPDPQNIVTQENLILPRNKKGREDSFALDTTCFLMFEDLPSRIPIGITSVSGQNTYEITVDIIGGFIGFSEVDVLEKHGNSTECLKACDNAVASYIIGYRNCSVGIETEKIEQRCGVYQSPLCNCSSGVQSLKLPKGPNKEYFSFRKSPSPLSLSETATSASTLYYFSPTQSVWIIPFNDKNTNNSILPNSKPIPCDSRMLQSLSSDHVWDSAARNYSNAVRDRDQGIKAWTHSLFPDGMPKLLLRFSLKLNEPREVDWAILERKVMSFYVQPVNDPPRIVVPPNEVPVSEDSLTPVPDLLLFDDGKDDENVTVTFTLDRGFATSFQGLVASDDMKLENIFASLVAINRLETFVRKFRLVSPDNYGPGNVDSVRVDVEETRPSGFGKPLSTSATFKIVYQRQEISDLPNVFLSVPGSQISLTENSHFRFDSLGIGHINGTDPSGARNGIEPPTSISLKISCRGPFGLLFVPSSTGRRILGTHLLCLSEITGLSLFSEYQGQGQFCRDVQIFGLVDQIQTQAQRILYFAFRYDFSLFESSSLVLTVIGPPSTHPINRNEFIVNENKVFFRVSVLFFSSVQLGANISRVFTEPWAVLQAFSPPITWAFEDTPARFRSELSQFVGELAEQLYEITISSRLNRVYISQPYRDSVNFEVGLGLAPENRIVFQASSTMVREALRHIMYVSKKNYNTQFDKTIQMDPCHRHCFAFYPTSTAAAESECSPLCRDFMSLYLSSKIRTNNLMLDDLMIDFNDLGSGGLGLTRFSTKIHVPLFVAAINDGPCLSFLGSVFVNCFDSSGNMILSSPSFNFEMDEGTSLSISLGEFSIVDYDMFEKGNLGCQNSSLVADAQSAAANGNAAAKLFLSSCPVIKVSISAGRGLVNINFRSDLVIYEGAVDQFTPSMKYFGSLEQVRQSLRNVRYRLSPSMRTFNYLEGLESITVSVDDGGFSGADPVGQFENVAASSTIVVPIKILPINNPPQVLLPSSSGGSFQTLENSVNLMRGMLPSGLTFSITDIDSDECNGVISVAMSVNFGHLDISFLKNQPILGRIQNLKLAEPVLPMPPEPTYCNVLSFAASNADIEEILAKIEYTPPSFINSEMLDPNVPALLTVSASDRKVLDGSFNCGRQLASSPTFVRSTSQIVIKPINHAPYATFSQNALANSHFEIPSLCGGRQFYSSLGDLYSWKSKDAFVSNGAVDSSIVNTPAYFPSSEIGSDTDLVPFDKTQGTQWVTIVRRGFIRQSFSILLAPDGYYFIQFYISRPSPPAVASSCEISIIHRNGSTVQKTFLNDLDIQSQSGWVRVQTPSFSGASCGYSSLDSFNPSYSCEVVIRSVPNTRGEGWGFAVDAVVLAFDRFQSIEGARIALRGFQAIDPDINSFSLASWASANVILQLRVSLSVARGKLFFQISPGILNVSSLVRSFPQGCNSTWCFEDVCSTRFRTSNSSAPNCFSKGVILFADCTLDQMRSFRSQCDASKDIPVIGLKYPPMSKLTWSSLQPGASPLPCPDGWSLLEDDPFLLTMQSKKACVNMGLSQLKGNFLSGAVSAVLVGSPKSINDILSTLTYVPNLYYNSQSNRGSENMVVDVNDLGHSGRANEPVLNSLTFFPIFVVAINNPPRIDALIPKLVLTEDVGPVPITFLAFNDVDSEDDKVAISLKLRCSHCMFSLNPNDRSLANQEVQAQVGDLFIHIQGRLPHVQSIFQSQSVFYKPFQNYFGEDVIASELNDRGGSGLGNFETAHDLPPSTTLRNTPLIVTYDFPVLIEPVNDISTLILADEATGTRLTLSQSGEVAILPLLRKQGTPEAFNYVFVEDVDSDVGISISLSCQSGIWRSMAPTVKHVTEDDGRTVSIISGNRTEINIWLKALQYIADETFLGSEDVVVKLSDNVTDPVTSATPTTLKIIIPISVLPIIRCLFNDCKTCIQQKDAKYSCGWCPSACNGQGRCIEAELSQDNPKFGVCPPLPNGQKWMMCEPPETDLVTPVVLGYSLVTLVAIGCVAFFYSYRSNYGSLRSSIRSKYRIIRTFARDFNILPHKDFQFVKLFVVASCGAVAVVVPTILGIVPMTGFNELLTGTTSLTIKSDHCEILFKDELASNGPVIRLNWEYYQDPAITILTNFCSPYQTLSVVNNRPPATKYQDYFCKLTFFSRASPTELFPSLYITAVGNNPTSLNDFSRSSPVPLGPNVLSVDGTWANVNLRGLTAGQILVPSLQRGYINLVNVTAMKYKIKTVDAIVFIQTPLAKPARVAAANPFMDFCFIHNAAKIVTDTAARDFQQRISVCKETCLNATYETGKILPPCGEYVFPNCTDSPTMMHDVPHFHPLIPGSSVYNRNVSCFLKCSPAAPNAEFPPVLLAPAVIKSPNPYDVQISTATGKITFITAGKSYPPSSGGATQALMPFSTLPNISPADLSVLNTLFHPFGSGTFPSADIIRVVFVGPGAPLGFYVWSVDPRYLLLPLELLDAASFGLLVPAQNIVRLTVSSTSCPPYDPVRGGPDLIAFYSIIFQGINNEIVPNSLIAFNDGINPGSYDQFYFDESVKSVQMRPLRISDNSFLYILFVLGIVVPIGVGFVCSVAVVFKFRAAKLLLVRSACENEARSIQMKTAGLGGAGSESVEELVSDEMRSRYDRKIGVFFALEYMWTDPDAEQSLVTKVFVSFTHCLVVAVVTTPMVVFAELYQKSFISNNCPFVLNPDNCQQTITLVMQASSALVKIFPIAAALELACYNARFSHSLLRRAVYFVFCTSLIIVACISIACLVALVLWTSFAVVTDPQKVVPFLTGGMCTIAHAFRLYPLATAAREKVRKALQQRSLQVTARLSGTLPLPLMSNIVHRQISQFLETRNLSLRAITKLLVSSILALILVIALLLLSLSAFSAPSIVMCIVGSCSVVSAAVVIHRLSAARFKIDDDNLNAMAASSIVGIKKSLDFVLRQMSQAARLLKAMEGDLSSVAKDDADDRSSSRDKQKSYRQAAQMAIMHDDSARTGRRPPAPPASKPPVPRLWRQRPVAQPPSFSPTQLPLPPHVQQQVQEAVDALQAEARWPGVRASGAGVSERQIRLGIRTARALAEDLPPAVAQHSANPSSVEDAFAAGVGQIKPDARRGAFQRLVRTRTARVLSEQNLDSDANTNL